MCRKRNIKETKQVYRAKKDGRLLNKNLDLTQEIEKLTIEEVSATPVDKIVPNGNLASSNIAEQETSSVGGQEQKKGTRSTTTG